MYKRIFGVMICCLLFGGGSLMASALAPDDDEYNPENPPEPTAVNICRVMVSATPEEGAYVSGGGKYLVNGNSVYISTSANNTLDYTYTFLYWTLNGEMTSYSKDFWFTPTKGTFDFVAHYQKNEVVFDPSNPEEPISGNVKRKYYLYLTSNIEGACSFSMASGNKIKEGTQLDIYAYPNIDYQFNYWMKDGEFYSYDQNLYMSMPSANTTLEAYFTEIPFDPDSPAEPTGSATGVDNSNRLLMDFSIGLSGSADKTRVVVNEKMTLGYDTGRDATKMISYDASYQIYSLDADGLKYSINERPADDGIVPLGFVVKQSGEVTIKATRLDCNAILVDKVLHRGQDMAVGGYTFTSNAGTFNDRFYIKLPMSYIAGDANGDGKVSYSDVVAVLDKILEGGATGNFVKTAADVNNDDLITIADALMIVDMIQEDNGNSSQVRGNGAISFQDYR